MTSDFWIVCRTEIQLKLYSWRIIWYYLYSN